MMQILVKNVLNKTLSLEVDKHESVAILKLSIEAASGLPVAIQQLRFNNQLLRDNQTLIDAHVGDGGVLMMHECVRDATKQHDSVDQFDRKASVPLLRIVQVTIMGRVTGRVVEIMVPNALSVLQLKARLVQLWKLSSVKVIQCLSSKHGAVMEDTEPFSDNVVHVQFRVPKTLHVRFRIALHYKNVVIHASQPTKMMCESLITGRKLISMITINDRLPAEQPSLFLLCKSNEYTGPIDVTSQLSSYPLSEEVNMDLEFTDEEDILLLFEDNLDKFNNRDLQALVLRMSEDNPLAPFVVMACSTRSKETAGLSDWAMDALTRSIERTGDVSLLVGKLMRPILKFLNPKNPGDEDEQDEEDRIRAIATIKQILRRIMATSPVLLLLFFVRLCIMLAPGVKTTRMNDERYANLSDRAALAVDIMTGIVIEEAGSATKGIALAPLLGSFLAATIMPLFHPSRWTGEMHTLAHLALADKMRPRSGARKILFAVPVTDKFAQHDASLASVDAFRVALVKLEVVQPQEQEHSGAKETKQMTQRHGLVKDDTARRMAEALVLNCEVTTRAILGLYQAVIVIDTKNTGKENKENKAASSIMLREMAICLDQTRHYLRSVQQGLDFQMETKRNIVLPSLPLGAAITTTTMTSTTTSISGPILPKSKSTSTSKETKHEQEGKSGDPKPRGYDIQVHLDDTNEPRIVTLDNVAFVCQRLSWLFAILGQEHHAVHYSQFRHDLKAVFTAISQLEEPVLDVFNHISQIVAMENFLNNVTGTGTGTGKGSTTHKSLLLRTPVLAGFLWIIRCMNSAYQLPTVRGIAQALNLTEGAFSKPWLEFLTGNAAVLNAFVRSSPQLMDADQPLDFLSHGPNRNVIEWDVRSGRFYDSLRDSDNKSASEFKVSIRRDQVFRDSFNRVNGAAFTSLRAGVRVIFKNEDARGPGVAREWFALVTRELLNADYGLFLPCTDSRHQFSPNPLSHLANPNDVDYFRFAGRFFALAMLNRVTVNACLAPHIYKFIMGQEVTLEDLRLVDHHVYQSFRKLLAEPIVDDLGLTFDFDLDEFGAVKTVELKAGGSSTSVTETNKHEYVHLRVQQILVGSVAKQLQALRTGFGEIIPAAKCRLLDAVEFEMLLCGVPEIDVGDWKKNTVLNGFSSHSHVIKWFWRYVESLSPMGRSKLLYFCTSVSRLSFEGFAGLSSTNKFSISRDDGVATKGASSSALRLPSAHTCFNQLVLPEFASYDMLRRAFTLVLREGGDGFAFA